MSTAIHVNRAIAPLLKRGIADFRCDRMAVSNRDALEKYGAINPNTRKTEEPPVPELALRPT